jgi:hypothetical protein
VCITGRSVHILTEVPLICSEKIAKSRDVARNAQKLTSIGGKSEIPSTVLRAKAKVGRNYLRTVYLKPGKNRSHKIFLKKELGII